MELNLSSDLLEVNFTPHELNTAMQLMDKSLSQMYLQNLRVAVFRSLCLLEFDPLDTAKQDAMKQWIYLRGQLYILDALIQGILSPSEIPLDTPTPQQQVFNPQGNTQ